MKIALDIGAHDGKDSIKLLDEGYKVYAFEPIRDMFKYFVEIELNYPQFTHLPIGVDLETGIKPFFKNTKIGTLSSLYQLNEEVTDKLYPEQQVENSINAYSIFTLSLYDFCNLENIQSIDYLHCDVQGNDFRVLKSLRDKISIVKKGVVEASGRSGLYKANNNIVDIKEYLIEHGFTTFNEVSKKPDNLEYDLYFSR